MYKNIYSYVFIVLPFSPKSFKSNCFLHKKTSHSFQDTHDLPLGWPDRVGLLCASQAGATWLCFHRAHMTLKAQFLNCDVHAIYKTITISQSNWEGLKDPAVQVYRVKTTAERHSCQMKQVYLPPCARFCSTFISLLGHWITLPVITGCASWIYPAPFSPDAAVVFHSLIRIQNATCCVHKRENRAEKTVQYWS